jgi:hypothetical protein
MSSIADLCGVIAGDSFSDEAVDPITFCTADWGLSLGRNGVPPMYPTQRFILKVYYDMELDDSDNRDIIVNDKFNEKMIYLFNEKEFFDYLVEEERVNITSPEARLNLHLVIGRRGTKTSIVSFIVAYELYKLLKHYSPQDYYQILPEDLIEITSVSTGEKTSKNFYDRVTGNIERAPFFKQFMLNTPNKTEMFFQTQRDIDKYGKGGRASIKLSASACNAKGLRGQNNLFVVFDEAAFFFKDDASGKKAASDKDDKAIYAAVTPSIAKFKNPDGSPAGRVVMISSPADRSGLFYEEYERSFNKSMTDLLMFQIPTWEMDPYLSTPFLKAEYSKNPTLFGCEYGANFSDRLAGWVEDPELIRMAMVPGLNYKERSLNRVPHFAGVDIGLKGDGTSIVIGHIINEADPEGQTRAKIEIDYAQVRFAKDEGKDYFKPEEMAEWIADITSRFYVVKGVMDQYYGMAIIPELEKLGINIFESVAYNDTKNSEVYQNMLNKFIAGTVRLPQGEPDPNKPGEFKDTELVKELLSLQSTQKSKYVIKVFAPQRDGCHDDLSDGLARCIHVATEYIDKGYDGKKAARASRGGGHQSGASSRVRSMRRKVELNRGVPRPGANLGGLGGMRRR